MHKLILDNLLLINHSNMFRPLSRSHHQGVRNPWELQSHCIDLSECCYVYVSASRYDSCGMLKHSTAIISRCRHIYITTLYRSIQWHITLKDFELPDDGFDWGAETCWSDWSVINYPELICAFRWFIFVFINTGSIHHSDTHFVRHKRHWTKQCHFNAVFALTFSVKNISLSL